MNSSLERRFSLAACALLATIALAGAVAALFVVQSRRNQSEAAAGLQQAEALQQARALLSSATSAYRGWQLTGDNHSLDAFLQDAQDAAQFKINPTVPADLSSQIAITLDQMRSSSDSRHSPRVPAAAGGTTAVSAGALDAVLRQRASLRRSDAAARLEAANRQSLGALEASACACLAAILLGAIGVLALRSRAQRDAANRLTILEKEERLRSCVDSAPIALMLLDPQGMARACNRRAIKLLELDGDEASGRKQPHIWSALAREDGTVLTGDETPDRTALREARSIEDMTLRLNRRADQLWVSLSITPIAPGASSVARYVLLAVEDITAKRLEREQALARTNELEAAVAAAQDSLAERTAERDSAAAASRGKSELLTNLSHSVRGPLDAMDEALAQLVVTRGAGEDSATVQELQSHTRTVASLITDVVDFARIEAGSLTIDNVEFSLRDTLEDVIATMAAGAAARGLDLVAAIPAGSHDRFKGDPARIRQVLLNLVSNAIKFTPKGDVVVSAAVERHGDQADVLLTVRDTGIGIPAARQRSVLEGFAPHTTSALKSGGSGLGLAVSSKLANLMGGALRLESEPGKGSAFTVALKLPCAAEERAAEAPAALQGLAVLVVDDSEAQRNAMCAELQGWGCRAEAASSGGAALQQLWTAADRQDPFALVLLDMQMPDMDADQTARLIRADARLDDVPLVLLHFNRILPSHEQLRTRGFSAAAGKPWLQAELLNAVLGAADPQMIARSAGIHVETLKPTMHGTVLVAEDNQVNLRLLQSILELLGCRVIAASTGRQAMFELAEATVDLILMDVQMPEMDGLETVRQIRQHERPTGKRVPVVGLSAHVAEGDRERCLKAGMDGCIAKPVDMNELTEALRKWLAPCRSAKPAEASHASDAPAAPAPAAEPAAAPAAAARAEHGQPQAPDAPFDVEQLLQNCDGDEDFAREMMTVFLRTVPQSLQGAREAIEKQDTRKVEDRANALVGAASTLGAETFKKACATLETAAKARELAALPKLLTAAETEYGRIAPMLRKAMQRKAA